MQEQMKNKILYTDEARCDLDSIWDYIALDLQNQQAAERLVNKIMDRVDQLEDFAESGMLLSSISEVIGEERLTASAILYSRTRNEVWMVGDCQLNHRSNLMTTLRKHLLQSLSLWSGTAVSSRQRDPSQRKP